MIDRQTKKKRERQKVERKKKRHIDSRDESKMLFYGSPLVMGAPTVITVTRIEGHIEQTK